ncbi:EAL domain-containing protein [Brevundimonas sp. Root1279]|uniref:EAL domain-containing protein n=1 Tax=Brevundimonas sp. Root1279 TaxID=1736443 RepID=UPI001F453B70|nr:EAL domain-containing protein [Brevundimonas sp. Root1279]
MAFASADVLLELDRGRVAFALGAGPAPGIDPATAWAGQSLDDLLDASCRNAVMARIAGLQPGVRSTPVDIRVLTGDGRARAASLRAFALPELAPFISCALSWEGAVHDVPAERPKAALDARGLLQRLGAVLALGGTGPELTVDFVQVPGLDGEGEARRRANAAIETRLQAHSLDQASAARLAPDRFALIRESSDISDLAEAVRAAGAAEGLDLSPITSRGEIGRCEAAIAVRTLRLALEDCLKDGADAGVHFGERLKRTVQDADRFRGIVRERQFTLAWQPIVALDTRAVHHFEALTRFGGAGQAPTGPISMAEELGLIEGLDLAVAEKALGQLRQPGFGLTKAAINVSAVSLTSDAYVQGLLRMTASVPDIRKRLMVEITETTALQDLDAANARIGALRNAGIKVCLDDFGVGAASLDYLRRLQIDVVKIDGGFVRDIAADRTARSMIGHLVELCRDMKVLTVAEMVETEPQADAVRALGVDYGQGWLFGRPTAVPAVTASAPAGRRRGEVASWG